MATRLGKRPNPKNYATYDPRGKARYRKDLAEYLKKKAAIEKEKNKLSTKKNLDKQKTANKKAVSTTKTKTTTKSKAAPKSTATKAKSLATGKTTSKTKAVETPKVSTTKRRTTTSRTKKPAAKKPLISNKQKLQIKNAAKKTIKTGKTVGKKFVAKTKQVASNVKGKVDATKKAFKKGKAPRPTTPQQKFVSKVYRGAKNYGKKVLKKGGKDLLKIGKGILKNPKSAIKGGVAGVASTALTDAINTRTERVIAKNKGMTLEEFRAFKKDPKNQRGIVSLSKKLVNKVRGKSNTQTSTTKNINKQKSNNTGLKVKKTERSSKVNTNKDYNAKTAKKQYNPKMATFREDSKANRDLQLEVQKQGKKKNKTVTYSRVLSPQAKNKISNTKKNKDKKTKPESKFIRGKGGRLLRRGSPTAMRAENKERARKRAQEAARKRRLNK